ncbi:MAG: tRNA (adenosine(37)-N6)-threonylcarbamoyltransferase complex ATPase subunit type 1 TsaE [Parcubacteria group bacterium]|nr:tRNA (adenosine(37)-N6)-threonylcarbamoyltransferase complex ATPase subunit type 1 TsaE [Parcubacteria group bacterium]
MKEKIITKNAEKTQEVGKLLATELRGGEVISLLGDLGGGKTTFTQGLATGLSVKETITSPTFTIMKKYPVEHNTIKNLYHLDLYRLSNPQELADLGFAEIAADPQNVTVIEWANKAKEIIPPENNLQIRFGWLGKDKREITFSTYSRSPACRQAGSEIPIRSGRTSKQTKGEVLY